MKKKEYYEMPYVKRRVYKKKLLKQARAFSIATVVGVGLVFASGTLWFSNAFAKRQDMIEFEKANNINYQGYVEQVKAEGLEKLQESVLAGEISFEEYENAKEKLEKPSEEEYHQTLEPEVLKEYNKHAKNVNRAIGYGFTGTLLSSAPAIACAVMYDKKTKECRELY